MSMKSYKALLFDCYGTLINWEQGMVDNTPFLSGPSAPSRDAYFSVLGKHENRIQVETPTMPYPEVLSTSYLATAKELGVEASEADAKAFGASVGSWPAFPDSAEALLKLHNLGLKLVILSNVNNDSFDVSKKKLENGFAFDAIYTAQNIGSYKPAQANFDYAVSHIKSEFGIDKDDILIVANSKLHDIQPGHKKGMKGAWISRARAVMGVSGLDDIVPDWEFKSMEEFAEAMGKDKA